MNRLNLITLGVKDMVESLTFYREGGLVLKWWYTERRRIPMSCSLIMEEQKYRYFQLNV